MSMTSSTIFKSVNSMNLSQCSHNKSWRNTKSMNVPMLSTNCSITSSPRRKSKSKSHRITEDTTENIPNTNKYKLRKADT